MSAAAAAFDTCINRPAVFTGRASKANSRSLTKQRARLISQPPENFLVDPESRPLPG
jgi:hypothetical protein